MYKDAKIDLSSIEILMFYPLKEIFNLANILKTKAMNFDFQKVFHIRMIQIFSSQKENQTPRY